MYDLFGEMFWYFLFTKNRFVVGGLGVEDWSLAKVISGPGKTYVSGGGFYSKIVTHWQGAMYPWFPEAKCLFSGVSGEIATTEHCSEAKRSSAAWPGNCDVAGESDDEWMFSDIRHPAFVLLVCQTAQFRGLSAAAELLRSLSARQVTAKSLYTYLSFIVGFAALLLTNTRLWISGEHAFL